MRELLVDIDQETKEFLNEIIEKTAEWKERINSIQLKSNVNGVKIYFLGKVLDAVDNLFDLCAKNSGESND